MTLWRLLPLALVLTASVHCSSDDDPAPSGAAGASTQAGMGGMGGSDAAGAGGMDSAGQAGSAGMADMGGMAGAGGTADAGAGGTAGSAGTNQSSLQAPTIMHIMPMAGALHVMWTNNQTDCDTVEGERKSGTDDFKVVFSVPGEADNKHDTTATANLDYTYRLRCKKGEQASPYSTEMTANPTKK